MRGAWITPRGRTAHFEYRDLTSDWNTISSILTNDEYALAALCPAEGIAVDVGAYVGAATVAMLLDNPELRVIAIEPLPENLELIRLNLELNAVQDRCRLLEGAVGTDTVEYGWEGSESATHHAYIGNANGMVGTASKVAKVKRISLASLGPVAFVKIDCEGGEWDFLDDPAVDDVPIIVGEWHPDGGYTRQDLLDRLANHRVEFSGPEIGPGGFLAQL